MSRNIFEVGFLVSSEEVAEAQLVADISSLATADRALFAPWNCGTKRFSRQSFPIDASRTEGTHNLWSRAESHSDRQTELTKGPQKHQGMRPTGVEPATFGLKDRRSLGPRKDPLTTELRALD